MRTVPGTMSSVDLANAWYTLVLNFCSFELSISVEGIVKFKIIFAISSAPSKWFGKGIFSSGRRFLPRWGDSFLVISLVVWSRPWPVYFNMLCIRVCDLLVFHRLWVHCNLFTLTSSRVMFATTPDRHAMLGHAATPKMICPNLVPPAHTPMVCMGVCAALI